MKTPKKLEGGKIETYLGDGVYAVFDGWHIWLDLRNQDQSRIALNPDVLRALDIFRARIVDSSHPQWDT